MKKNKATTRISRITVPERCDPRAKLVFAEMRRQGVTYDTLEWKSGILRSTFKAWRLTNRPGMDTMDAALGVLGWSLLPVPHPDRLDPEVRADLEAIVAKHGLDTIPNQELVAMCVSYRHPHAPVYKFKQRKAA